MNKLLLLTTLFFLADAQTVTMGFYSDAACSNAIQTLSSPLLVCIDTSSGGTNSSMKYTLCNSTAVFGYMYNSADCNSATQIGTVTKTPNSCTSLGQGQPYEKYTCSSTPPSPPSPAPSPSPSFNSGNVKVYFGSPTCSGTPSINKDFTVNGCLDTSGGGFSTSFKFTLCNSTRILGYSYMNNFCNGIAATSINAPVGVCFNNNGDGEFYTCSSSSPPSSPIKSSANSIYHMNILVFFIITIFAMILI